MASPAPPPVADLLADLATLIDVPPDLPGLLAELPRADLYLQDEVQAALHPTLTRVWSRRGRRGQRDRGGGAGRAGLHEAERATARSGVISRRRIFPFLVRGSSRAR